MRTKLLLFSIALGITSVCALQSIIAATTPPAEATLRLVESRHYAIHTDLDDALATDLSQRLDAMFEQYAKTFAEFQPQQNGRALPVYLFKTRDAYLTFTSPAGVNTGGVFVSGRRSFLAAYEQGQGRDELRRTLQHEAFHQFARSSISTRLPIWINEGMAQAFEESIWTGREFIPDQIPPRRLRQLRADMNQHRLIEFDPFVSTTREQWTSTLRTDINKAAVYYNQAWAMTVFCSTSGNSGYSERFKQLLILLHTDDNVPAELLKKCFPDLKDFRQQFNKWAAGLTGSPEAALVEQQGTLGDFLIAISKGRGTPDDVANFRQLVVSNNLKIQYMRGKLAYWTSDRSVQYFSEPGRSSVHTGPTFLSSRRFGTGARHHLPTSPIGVSLSHAFLRTRLVKPRTKFWSNRGPIKFRCRFQNFRDGFHFCRPFLQSAPL